MKKEERRMLKTDINEAIARVEDWKGKEISYEPVSGGITNPNFKVLVDGEAFFLKIPGAGTDFIDRENCHLANVIAEKTGAGPKVFYYYEDTGVEIFEWLDGYRQALYSDVYDRETFRQMITGIADYHNIKDMTLPLRQSIFEQAWDMIDRAKQGTYLPPWHKRMEYMLHIFEEAINNWGVDLKPCHNDFWTNNMMYNDEKGEVKIIDWEYASMNDPYFDLASVSGTNYLTEAMDVELCKIYHGGEFNEPGFAKMKLYKIASDIKWGYWSLQQYIHSDVDFDYYSWYGTKIARLQHFWNDPRLDIWVNLLNKTPIYRE